MNPLSDLRLWFCVLVVTSAVSAGEPPVRPELRGMLATGTDRRFALSIPGGETAWLSVGGKFAGWTLKEFRPAEDVLVLINGAEETRLKLSSSKIGESDLKATLADADAVLSKMKFEEMFAKIIEQQKKTVADMTKRSLATNSNGVDPTDAEAFQAKVLDTVFAEMKPEDMKADFAKLYSEVFTKAELQGLSDFYSTPAGQAMSEKSPEVQKRTMEIMMPRMMRGMAKIKPLSAEFAKQQAEKKAAAGTSATPAPEVP
jgi:hypothetical protein